MTSNKCGWNSFPEPLTGGMTCTKCIYVCKPFYHTPELCKRYCPEYLKRIGTSTLPPVMHLETYPENQDDNGQQILPVNCIILAAVIIFCVLFSVAIWLYFRKKCRDGAKKDHEAVNIVEQQSLLVESHLNLSSGSKSSIKSSTGKTPTSDSSGGKSSGSNSSGGKASESDSSQSSASGVNSAGITTSTDGHFSACGSSCQESDGRSSENIVCSGSSLADRCGGSVSADRSCVGSSSGNMSVLCNASSSRSNKLSSVQPDKHGETSLKTNYASTASSERSILSDFLLISTLTQLDATEEQKSPTRSWHDVLRVYNAINYNLHELTWVVGCVLDQNKIHIIADHETSDDMSDRQLQIRNIIPETISSEIFQLTFDLPSLKVRCGNYGTGCVVMNERGKIARLTIQGSRIHEIGDETDVFVFTVAHLLREGESCQLVCQCDSKVVHELKAACLCHVDTINEESVLNIKHKLYDLSVIRMPGFRFRGNTCQVTYKGCRLFFDIDVPKVEISPHSIMPGMKVLIFADHTNTPIIGCISDEAMFTCRSDKSATEQVINFIQIQSLDKKRSLDFDGVSGSLVVHYPDDSFVDGGIIRVKAFALVIGTNKKRPDRAIALPLWDQIVKLFQESKSLADLEDCITFQGHHRHWLAYDSGICSQLDD